MYSITSLIAMFVKSDSARIMINKIRYHSLHFFCFINISGKDQVSLMITLLLASGLK